MQTCDHWRRSRRFFGLVALAVATASFANSTAAGAAVTPTQGPVVTDPAQCASAVFTAYGPKTDPYAINKQVASTGAPTYHNAGYTGRGIDVAVIDTGVAPVAGLNGLTKVIHGPDLSFESQTEFDTVAGSFAHIDTYGHGTHMAGIIAGSDAVTGYRGMAPDARIVSVKVADSQGAVDVTQLIAAIDWVVQHRNDPTIGLNIRVLNLSLGLGGIGDKDVINYAATQAWKAGIVVVASTGNDGQSAGVQAPANSGQLIAVGAYDVANNTATEFTSGANMDFRAAPDILAPGRSVPSLRVPADAADEEIAQDCRNTIAAGKPWSSPILGANGQWVRGSGTSQAAATVSGAAALILSKDPSLSPDQVKRLIRNNATELAATNEVAGKGALNLTRIFSDAPPRDSYQGGIDGGGTLSDARAFNSLPCLNDAALYTYRGTLVNGIWQGGLCSALLNLPLEQRLAALEVDIFGKAFDTKQSAALSCIDPGTHNTCITNRNPTGNKPWFSAWGVEFWNGRPLIGAGWRLDGSLGQFVVKGFSWASNAMTAKDWLGSPFSGKTWRNSTWDGKTWRHTLDGKTWRTGSWLGALWSGKTWRDHAWR